MQTYIYANLKYKKPKITLLSQDYYDCTGICYSLLFREDYI